MQISRQKKGSGKPSPIERAKDKLLLIFDLDDTLIDTSDVYCRARTCFLEVLRQVGIAPDLALKTFEEIESSHILEYGFAPERYGRSMHVAYRLLAKQCRMSVHKRIENRLEGCGRIVIEECPKLIEGALEVLEWASKRHDVCLVTRGIADLQLRKAATTGVSRYFKRIEVVPQKNAQVLKRVIEEEGAAPSSTWVVGDSVKSDINPGIEVGARCVLYLYTHTTYHWQQEYGDLPKGPFYVAKTLCQIRDIIEAPERFTMVTKL